MKQKKVYLEYTPNQETLDFFGYEKDEKGFFYWENVTDEHSNAIAWQEYWNQFTENEMYRTFF